MSNLINIYEPLIEAVKVHSGEIEPFAEAQKRVDESAPVVRANLAQGKPNPGIYDQQTAQITLLAIALPKRRCHLSTS